MKQVNEMHLIDRILGGHIEDYGYFLERYGQEVFAVVARIVIQQEDAEEITQDAFVKAYNHLDSFAGQASFSTWICRIAYNSAITFLRKKRKDLFSMDEDERWLNTISDSMADEMLSDENEERVVLLEQAIDRLSPDDKTIVILFYYEERSLKDIAYIMGIKGSVEKAVNMLSTRLSRIRKKLFMIIRELEDET